MKMYLGSYDEYTRDVTYTCIGDYESGIEAAHVLINKGYTLEEIKEHGIFTDNECVFGDDDTI